MDTKHTAKRILFLGDRDADILSIIKDLTGTAPILTSASPGAAPVKAGLTHEWHIKTAYFDTTVPLWIDEFADIESWKADFSIDEAGEVVQAVGAWVYVFAKPSDGSLLPQHEKVMKAIAAVVKRHSGDDEDEYVGGGDTALLAVAKPPGPQQVEEVDHADGSEDCVWDQEEEEEFCGVFGFEYVDYFCNGMSSFGEKVGLERLKEALETAVGEWIEGGVDMEVDSELEEGDREGLSGTDKEEAEMMKEIFGLRSALLQERDDEEARADDAVQDNQAADQVDDLDILLSRLMAVKERSAGLPEAQRKKMAAKAVQDLMKEHPNI